MKKKLLTTLACFAMLVVGAIGIVGCCDNKNPATITPFAVCKEAKIGEVTFETEDDVKIMSYAESGMDGPEDATEQQKNIFAKTYVVQGTASEFSQEQAEAYGDPSAEGEKYIVLKINVPAGKSYRVEWVNTDPTEQPNFTLSQDAKVIDTATDPTNNQLIVRISGGDNLVLGVEIENETYLLYFNINIDNIPEE